MKDGKPFTYHGIYVYWFVDDHQLTASHGSRMWSMAGELLRTGVLERWAYITCFSVCEPGQEEATYARMQKFIQASVPRFRRFPVHRAPELPPSRRPPDSSACSLFDG